VGSCAMAGRAHVEGKGVKKDLGRAAALFAKGCPEPPPPPKFASMAKDACVGLSGMHLEGKGGVEKSAAKAEAVLLRGCSDRIRMTCVDLSAFYAKGAKGMPKDAAKAEKVLRDACDKNDVSSCGELGKQLEKNDLGIARAFYEDACARTRFPPLCKSAERLGGKAVAPSGPPGPPPKSGPPSSPPPGPPPAKKGP
jgi:TPR repeat protein